jgi:Amidohydrolase family
VSAFDLVFRAPRVVTAAGEVAACVAVRDGRVAAISPLRAALSGDETLTLADDEALLPGPVDTHVHVNEPGRTEWEGFTSATRAAAAGGITSILDMPLNSVPPTVEVAALEAKRKAAQGQVHVDVGFWGGAVPGNLGELRGLHDAGVFGRSGAASPRSSSACPRSGRRPGPAATAWRRWPAGWPSARPTWSAWVARAASPSAATPTSACSPPTRPSWSTRPAAPPPPGHALRRPSAGRGGPRHLAARPPG